MTLLVRVPRGAAQAVHVVASVTALALIGMWSPPFIAAGVVLLSAVCVFCLLWARATA